MYIYVCASHVSIPRGGWRNKPWVWLVSGWVLPYSLIYNFFLFSKFQNHSFCQKIAFERVLGHAESKSGLHFVLQAMNHC